ncbi:MAG: heparinase II/III family protein [Deltaproteobacteria bacterium]|nr:heparinase II/III family protein [Deltaproteobacteria bacterium]
MSRLSRLPRIWRTLRPLRSRQMIAQAAHALVGIRPPRPWHGPTPGLRVRRVDVPFLPGPRHAHLEPGLSLQLINRRIALDRPIDWASTGQGRLFAYHLHQHDFLRAERVVPRARAEWMLDWIRRHPHGVGWDPHPISLRIVTWAKLLVTPAALTLSDDEEAEIRNSMARQLDALSRNVEVRLQANHLLSNLIGLCSGGVLFDGPHADRWLARGAPLLGELAEQVGDDGLHVERSPMYHALLLESVLDLIGLAQAAPNRLPEPLTTALHDTAGPMLGALDVLAHPDGEIALFADSAFGIAHAPDVLHGYAQARGITAVAPARPGVLDTGRYVRLSGGTFTLIASVGGPAPAWQPGHAHCDALGFELSCGDQRVVTDTGVFEYVPGERRDRARATLAHATLEVGDAEQAETWAAHRIGGRPCVELDEVEPGRHLVASCASWSTPDTLHRRTWTMRDGDLEIRDEIQGSRRPIRLALPLAPGLEPRLAHDVDGGPEAHLPLPGGRRLVVALPVSARWRIERAAYYPEFGLDQERACLIGESDDFEDGTWCFRLAT